MVQSKAIPKKKMRSLWLGRESVKVRHANAGSQRLKAGLPFSEALEVIRHFSRSVSCFLPLLIIHKAQRGR